MFNKNKFADILKKINETYDTMTEFAQKASFDRTYISKYINLKLDNPPTPKILQKIANASNGIITYDALMEICGYVDNIKRTTHEKILDYFGFINFDNNLVSQELIVYIEKNNFDYNDILTLVKILQKYSDICENQKAITLSNFVDNFNLKLTKKIKYIIKEYSSSLIYLYNRFNFNNNIKDVIESFCFVFNVDKTATISKFYMCPVYGRIAAGQPNWIEECLEGRMPIDPDLMGIVNPEECFFLKVNGESMNKIVKNNAFALIRKTDWVENGEIAVVLVNGYDATLKKFTKQGDLVILEPMSTDTSFTTQVYNKDTEIKIIGKYIGKMEINK